MRVSRRSSDSHDRIEVMRSRPNGKTCADKQQQHDRAAPGVAELRERIAGIVASAVLRAAAAPDDHEAVLEMEQEVAAPHRRQEVLECRRMGTERRHDAVKLAIRLERGRDHQPIDGKEQE